MNGTEALHRGRAAFRAQAWREASTQLSAADQVAPLGGDDLERLAVSTYLAGNDAASVEAWTRAYNLHLHARSDVPRAARCTFWMVLELLSLGEWARAAGWLATAQRLLDQGNHDCPERGLLQVLFARAFLKEQNEMAAYDAASQAAALGDRFNDPELKVFGRLSQALVHARRGEADAAAALFDEVMVAVTNGSVSPIGAGVVYCAVIGGCHEILDVGRAREWTAALATWCNAQSDLVAYRGQCRVHRAETMRLCGAWTDAMAEARQAFSGPSRTPGRLDNFDTVAPPVRDYATGAAFCG